MASRLFNAIGKIGIGLAVTGGVVQSALYNGMVWKVAVWYVYVSLKNVSELIYRSSSQIYDEMIHLDLERWSMNSGTNEPFYSYQDQFLCVLWLSSQTFSPDKRWIK